MTGGCGGDDGSGDRAEVLRRAQDRNAQLDLNLAFAVAKVYYVDHDAYTGFGVDEAATIEPSLTWSVATSAPSGEGAVAIAVAEGDFLLLLADSLSGNTFCVGDDVMSVVSNVEVRGIGKATTYEECEALPDWPAPTYST